MGDFFAWLLRPFAPTGGGARPDPERMHRFLPEPEGYAPFAAWLEHRVGVQRLSPGAGAPLVSPARSASANLHATGAREEERPERSSAGELSFPADLLARPLVPPRVGAPATGAAVPPAGQPPEHSAGVLENSPFFPEANSTSGPVPREMGTSAPAAPGTSVSLPGAAVPGQPALERDLGVRAFENDSEGGGTQEATFARALAMAHTFPAPAPMEALAQGARGAEAAFPAREASVNGPGAAGRREGADRAARGQDRPAALAPSVPSPPEPSAPAMDGLGMFPGLKPDALASLSPEALPPERTARADAPQEERIVNAASRGPALGVDRFSALPERATAAPHTEALGGEGLRERTDRPRETSAEDSGPDSRAAASAFLGHRMHPNRRTSRSLALEPFGEAAEAVWRGQGTDATEARSFLADARHVARSSEAGEPASALEAPARPRPRFTPAPPELAKPGPPRAAEREAPSPESVPENEPPAASAPERREAGAQDRARAVSAVRATPAGPEPVSGSSAARSMPPPFWAGEPSAPVLASGHEALIRTILSRARLLLPEGAVELRFRLEPPEFGALRVRLRARGERLRVEIVAQHSGALEGLRAAASRLEQQLQAAGFRDTEVWLAHGDQQEPRERHAAGDENPARVSRLGRGRWPPATGAAASAERGSEALHERSRLNRLV